MIHCIEDYVADWCFGVQIREYRAAHEALCDSIAACVWEDFNEPKGWKHDCVLYGCEPEQLRQKHLGQPLVKGTVFSVKLAVIEYAEVLQLWKDEHAQLDADLRSTVKIYEHEYCVCSFTGCIRSILEYDDGQLAPIGVQGILCEMYRPCALSHTGFMRPIRKLFDDRFKM